MQTHQGGLRAVQLENVVPVQKHVIEGTKLFPKHS